MAKGSRVLPTYRAVPQGSGYVKFRLNNPTSQSLKVSKTKYEMTYNEKTSEILLRFSLEVILHSKRGCDQTRLTARLAFGPEAFSKILKQD